MVENDNFVNDFRNVRIPKPVIYDIRITSTAKGQQKGH